jgi:hypothetical protein
MRDDRLDAQARPQEASKDPQVEDAPTHAGEIADAAEAVQHTKLLVEGLEADIVLGCLGLERQRAHLLSLAVLVLHRVAF